MKPIQSTDEAAVPDATPPETPAQPEGPAQGSIAPSSEPGSPGRFHWVDAIRGLACVGVVMRHLFFSPEMHEGLARVFPSWLEWFHMAAAAGVYAFFVISGFVIAHSLRNNTLTGKAVVNFIVRRQVRLDPVYWICMGLFLVLPGLLVDSQAWSRITIPNFLVNAFYLQDLLHKQTIVGPAWTLCIEVQFYLVFIVLLVIGRAAKRLVPQNNLTVVSLAILFSTGLLALVLKHFVFLPPLFISYWHYFALGALTYYAMQGVMAMRLYGAFVLAFFVSLCLSPASKIANFGPEHSLALASMTVAFATALSFLYAGQRGKMGIWGNNATLQYLGKISYTLYLIHVLVISLVPRYFGQKEGGDQSAALGFYFLCFAISLLGAHILHTVVEKPSMNLSARLKRA